MGLVRESAHTLSYVLPRSLRAQPRQKMHVRFSLLHQPCWGVISRLFCLARISIQETLRARLGLYGRGLSTVCAFLVGNLPLSILL